jgi:hypothetical protein
LTSTWSVIGITQWLLYFVGYARPADHPPIGFSCEYLLVGVGAALFENVNAAWVAGFLILILAAAAVVLVIIRRQVSEQSFWLAALAYVLATLCAITIGRSRFGVVQAS